MKGIRVKREIQIKKSKMESRQTWNWRKLQSMGSLGAIGFLMLFQYQNCAPAAGIHSRSLASASSEDGIVTTIDDVNATTGLAFSQSKVQVPPSDSPTVIEGACSQHQGGAVLGWNVRDSDGNMTQSGYSVCDKGQFQVTMAPANQLDCDQSYEVRAQLSKGQVGTVEVSRDCSSSN